MLITITGKAGSGKSTLARMLAAQLGYEYISIGDIKRKLAESMGMNIFEFNKLGEELGNEREFDLKYEDYQKNLPLDGKIILESRLGFWCQPRSFKIFLTVSDEVATQRIQDQQRTTDQFSSWEEALEQTRRRNEDDLARYKKLYDIVYTDPKNFDLFLDTGGKNADEMLEIILNKLQEHQQTHLQ